MADDKQSSAHGAPPSTTTTTTTNAQRPNYFETSTELADLGRARFDHDTAAIDRRRDLALVSHQPVTVHSGRAPKGLESQVFAWNTFQFTTEERDEREALKGDLHMGQLHRQNRAARGVQGTGKAFTQGGGGGGNGSENALCAGRKPQDGVLPLAKGFPKELNKSMFWDEPIV